ncbi:MAG: aminoacyl-tRNA deacylase, partial [Victivallales bacterium]|nr:aminoacyl-tRNA deacylase [Victivallales bacterium]
MNKTNAMRQLEQEGIPFRVHEYDAADGLVDAVTVAGKIALPPEQCFKTLVTCGADHNHYVFVIPGSTELNLKKAARAANCKSMRLIPLKGLLPLTGYIHGGCSPIGMKKELPTFIDETAILYETVGV